MANIILIGFKGCGKTYFGSSLAKDLGFAFLDTDCLIEELYEKESCDRSSCRQIAKRIGEEGFRDLERRVIFSIEVMPKRVISVGGGAVLDKQNCQKLQAFGKLIYLETNKNILKERMFLSGIPSFLDADDPDGSFEKMYATRKGIYERLCSRKVVITGKTNSEVLFELKKILCEL
jgi:shikimate kinase